MQTLSPTRNINDRQRKNKESTAAMRKQTQAASHDMDEIAEDARALMIATANVAGEKVERARKRLVAALERGSPDEGEASGSAAGRVEERVGEIHKRVTAALDHGREVYSDVRDDVVKRAKAANHRVHANPYQALGIALGIGALIGFLGSRRGSHNGNGNGNGNDD